MQIKFDVKLVRFYAMCAASAWSKQCILVHFVFASTLRCLLPDWQYKQKKTQQPTIKGSVIFIPKILIHTYFVIFSKRNISWPTYLVFIASKTSWNSAFHLAGFPNLPQKYIIKSVYNWIPWFSHEGWLLQHISLVWSFQIFGVFKKIAKQDWKVFQFHKLSNKWQIFR